MHPAAIPGTTSKSRTILSPSGEAPPTVYIVEDDRDLREFLAWTLKGNGYRSVLCECGEKALNDISPDNFGCVLIDLSLPDMSGLDLQRELREGGCWQPFIVLTGSKDVSLAVESLKRGAVDLLQKPYDSAKLLQRVAQAVASDRDRRRLQFRLDRLTAREREILLLVAEGQATKEIAGRFQISPRTVEVHRHHIMKKMGATSLVQLIQTLHSQQPTSR
jgi:two-component system, LuxR family, response regulator FixJ